MLIYLIGIVIYMETTQDIKQFSNTREERAKAILEIGNPETLDEFTYLVPSQNSDKKYKVTHFDSLFLRM